jgi:hypothetical protein
MLSMLQWWYDKQGKQKNPEKNPRQCRFVHYESHMNSPGIELGAPPWDIIAKIIRVIWCKDVVSLSNTERLIRQRLDQERRNLGLAGAAAAARICILVEQEDCDVTDSRKRNEKLMPLSLSKFLTLFDSTE